MQLCFSLCYNFFITAIFSHSIALLCTFSLPAKDGMGGERTSRIKKEQMTKDLMIMTLVNRTFGEIGVSNKDKGKSET